MLLTRLEEVVLRLQK